jgi:predicted ABC-class ATPase
MNEKFIDSNPYLNRDDKKESLLSCGRFIDGVITVIIASRLLKSLKKWDAYKFGIIDDKGNKIRDPKTSQERDSYSFLNRLLIKIKQLLTTKGIITLTVYYTLIKEESENKKLDMEELIESKKRKLFIKEAHEEIIDQLVSKGISLNEYYDWMIQDFCENGALGDE